MTDGGFTELFVAFGHELRDAGLPVGTDDVMAMCASLAELDPSDIRDTYWAGRCTLVGRRDQAGFRNRRDGGRLCWPRGAA